MEIDGTLCKNLQPHGGKDDDSCKAAKLSNELRPYWDVRGSDRNDR